MRNIIPTLIFLLSSIAPPADAASYDLSAHVFSTRPGAYQRVQDAGDLSMVAPNHSIGVAGAISAGTTAAARAGIRSLSATAGVPQGGPANSGAYSSVLYDFTGGKALSSVASGSSVDLILEIPVFYALTYDYDLHRLSQFYTGVNVTLDVWSPISSSRLLGSIRASKFTGPFSYQASGIFAQSGDTFSQSVFLPVSVPTVSPQMRVTLTLGTGMYATTSAGATGSVSMTLPGADLITLADGSGTSLADLGVSLHAAHVVATPLPSGLVLLGSGMVLLRLKSRSRRRTIEVAS